MEAWNVYLAVRIDLNPSWHAILDCVPEDYHLHQFQVRTLHGYDVKFRIKAASDPSLKWDVLDSGLWLECKTAHSVQSTRWPFSNCGSTTHYPNNCLICFLIQAVTKDSSTLLADLSPQLPSRSQPPTPAVTIITPPAIVHSLNSLTGVSTVVKTTEGQGAQSMGSHVPTKLLTWTPLQSFILECRQSLC